MYIILMRLPYHATHYEIEGILKWLEVSQPPQLKDILNERPISLPWELVSDLQELLQCHHPDIHETFRTLLVDFIDGLLIEEGFEYIQETNLKY